MEEKGCTNLAIILFAVFLFLILCMDKRKEPEPIYIPTSTKSTPQTLVIITLKINLK